MINKWLVTGDTHGAVIQRLNEIEQANYGKPNEIGVIILGDAGINYYLNRSENKKKETINAMGYTLYCVRGNHEERPQNVPGMIFQFDANVNGLVYFQPEYPNIRYFQDYGIYNINNYSVAVIGGAYSVDKYWRLENGNKWFPQEQLSEEEMKYCEQTLADYRFDFVLTHTCPFSWQPIDLFLGGVDQTKVDNTMELWMDNLKETFKWDVWLFGHYHDNRLERPGVEMYFTGISDLDRIYNLWNEYKENPESIAWFHKSPFFYKGD